MLRRVLKSEHKPMSTSRFRFLSEQQVLSFKLNGFMVIADVLTADEVKALAERCEMIAAGV